MQVGPLNVEGKIKIIIVFSFVKMQIIIMAKTKNIFCKIISGKNKVQDNW